MTMNLKELPSDIEDIILNYYYQLEHQEKFRRVLFDINDMEYFNNPGHNCSSFKVNINPNHKKSFHIKMCKNCGNFYRTSIIIYRWTQSISFRYSYYNSWLDEEREIVENSYIVNHLGGENMNWSNTYRNRQHNPHISCLCNIDIFGLIGW